MGILNPITFARKSKVVWNALVGMYTFANLGVLQQQMVQDRVEDLVKNSFGKTLDEFFEHNNKGVIVAFNFMVYAMGELGITPALPGEQWLYVENPMIAAIGAEEIIPTIQSQILKKHGVNIPFDEILG